MRITSAIEVFSEIASAGELLPAKVANLLCQTTLNIKGSQLLPVIPQQHPLGFFCLRWKLDEARSLRIHIWDRQFDWTQTPNWPIHDHVFAFRSAVLLGSIQNKTYESIQNTNRRRWGIYEVDYINQCSVLMKKSDTLALSVSSSIIQQAGSIYELPAGILHRSVLRSDLAISALAVTTNLAATFKPRVVGLLNSGKHQFDRFNIETGLTTRIVDKTIALLRESTSR